MSQDFRYDIMIGSDKPMESHELLAGFVEAYREVTGHDLSTRFSRVSSGESERNYSATPPPYPVVFLRGSTNDMEGVEQAVLRQFPAGSVVGIWRVTGPGLLAVMSFGPLARTPLSGSPEYREA